MLHSFCSFYQYNTTVVIIAQLIKIAFLNLQVAAMDTAPDLALHYLANSALGPVLKLTFLKIIIWVMGRNLGVFLKRMLT